MKFNNTLEKSIKKHLDQGRMAQFPMLIKARKFDLSIGIMIIIIIIYSICIAPYNTILCCCEHYKLNSDFSIWSCCVVVVYPLP